jgi:hypothetical protein
MVAQTKLSTVAIEKRLAIQTVVVVTSSDMPIDH